MTASDEWKDKYFRQLENLEQAEQAWRDERHLLQRLLVRTCLAAEGQSASLDRLLDRLRDALRGESPEIGDLRRLQEDIDELVVGLDASRGQQVERIRQSLQRILGCLGRLDRERRLRRDLRSLDRELGREELQFNGINGWLQRISEVQERLLDEGPGKAAKQGGFWQRLFHGGNQSAAAAETSESTGLSLAPDAAVPQPGRDRDELLQFVEHISRMIERLLTQVSFPPPAEEEARHLQARVLEMRNWQDLDQALDTVAGLMIAAVGRSQQEFERFLQRLDERLVHIQGYFQAQRDSQQDRRSASDSLERDLGDELRSLNEAVSEASDLPRLKLSVKDHLDRIGQSLEAFRAREADHEALMVQHVGALQEKLAALEAQSEQMRRQLQEEHSRALTDVLTGLPNREAWEQRLNQEYERWKRYRQAVSLVIIDIDHFKAINDNFGHLAGDKAIRLIGRSLRDRLRTTDFVARYGGEEFAVLMPETNTGQAATVIDELRRHVASLPFHFRGSQVSITFSAGLVGFDDDRSVSALFERADRALYRAKASGRDRVLVDDQTRAD